jgi:hypothetical protein
VFRVAKSKKNFFSELMRVASDEPEESAMLEPLDQVIIWIVEGMPDGKILAKCKKLWPSTDAEELYSLAVDQVADASQIETDVIYGWCLMARRELYRKMLNEGDYQGALKATERIESLTAKLHDRRRKGIPGEPADPKKLTRSQDAQETKEAGCK